MHILDIVVEFRWIVSSCYLKLLGKPMWIKAYLVKQVNPNRTLWHCCCAFVICSCLRAIRTLQKNGHIPSDPSLFKSYAEHGHFVDVRVAALEALVDYTRGRHLWPRHTLYLKTSFIKIFRCFLFHPNTCFNFTCELTRRHTWIWCFVYIAYL